MAVVTLTPKQQADIKDALLMNHELVIRDMAGTVLSLVRSRADHPSFGTTKASIRTAQDRMDGAIGVYMVLAGQAAHTSIAVLAEFLDPATKELVDRARLAAAATLQAGR